MKRVTLITALGLSGALLLPGAAIAAGQEQHSTDFQALDENNDGSLTYSEIRGKEAIQENWNEIDSDQDGIVDRVEFSAFEAARGMEDEERTRWTGQDSMTQGYEAVLPEEGEERGAQAERSMEDEESTRWTGQDSMTQGYEAVLPEEDEERGAAMAAGSTDFEALDENNDGSLTYSEARGKEAIQENWNEIDSDRDGIVDRVEFSAFEAEQGMEDKESTRWTGQDSMTHGYEAVIPEEGEEPPSR